jgi:hypothetical protein
MGKKGWKWFTRALNALTFPFLSSPLFTRACAGFEIAEGSRNVAALPFIRPYIPGEFSPDDFSSGPS